MAKERKFRHADYEAAERIQITLGEALPEEHLARFIVSVVALLDLSEIYERYSDRGGMPYAPEVLLGLLLYGYATGTFGSRKLERATYESLPFRYIAGNMHPDHDTLNQFRKDNLATLKQLFVQVLVLASVLGSVRLGNISIDGSKVHADASKSKAVSYGRILSLEKRLQQEIEELFALAEQVESEQPHPKAGAQGARFDSANEVGRRRTKLADLAQAKAVIEAMAGQRQAEEQADYERKLAARQAQAERTGKKARGRAPQPPEPGPRDKDQYNFTDPESRIMKNGNNKGFEQAYNAQAAVEHESRLIVGNTLSNHPNDKQAGSSRLRLSPQNWVHQLLQRWMPVTSAPRPSKPSKPWALTPTSRSVGTAIRSICGRSWRASQNHRQTMPTTRSRCSTSCAPQWERPSTDCARARSSRSSASSRR